VLADGDGNVRQVITTSAGILIGTTAVQLAATDTFIGAFYFISAYNTTGGAQGSWIVATRAGVASVVYADNATGLTVSFTNPSGALKIAVTSGQIAVVCRQLN
jgi:hypothetical protein